jgi:hypothetical protein
LLLAKPTALKAAVKPLSRRATGYTSCTTSVMNKDR